MPPDQYISASLQLAWVYAGDGSISRAIGVIQDVSDVYNDYSGKITMEDRDLRDLLQLSMFLGQYEVAKSIAKESYGRMANKYDDVAFFAALVMECTGVHDDQMYALEVYDHLLNLCGEMPFPSRECSGIVSPQLFFPRQLWYHRAAPLIEDRRTKQVFSTNIYRQRRLELMNSGIDVDKTHIRRQQMTSEIFWSQLL